MASPMETAGPAVTSIGELEGLRRIAVGKVRELFLVDDSTLLFVATDRVSAFDVVMSNGIPGKGKVLNQLSVFWFTEVFQDVATHGPNHLITADIEKMPPVVQKHAEILRGRCMLVKKLNVVPIEAIVRGYIVGSGWKEYERLGSVCAISLPKGLKKCQKLPEAIFTPSTKAEQGEHDENISENKAADMIGRALCDKVREKSLKFYSTARDFAAKKGIIIADTKFEFATDSDGNVVLVDEVMTPDSSRFWAIDKYTIGENQDSYDKQYVRDYLESINFDKKTPAELPAEVVRNTTKKYVEIFKILTGRDPEL
eukprot:673542_1